MITLTTPRLSLRPPRREDESALLAIVGDARVMRYVLAERPMSAEEAREFLERYFTPESDPTGFGALTETSTRSVIGFAGLIETRCLGERDWEFGFVLGQGAWGKGYATEIGRAQIEYALGPLGLARVLALAHADNTKSVHALVDKLGMKWIKDEPATAQRGPRRVFGLERARAPTGPLPLDR